MFSDSFIDKCAQEIQDMISIPEEEEKPIEEQIPPQPEDTNQAFPINQAPITPLEEPEAPDPSIFEQIANQIEAQTSEESNTTDSETNQ